jgi:hypothetical protein
LNAAIRPSRQSRPRRGGAVGTILLVVLGPPQPVLYVIELVAMDAAPQQGGKRPRGVLLFLGRPYSFRVQNAVPESFHRARFLRGQKPYDAVALAGVLLVDLVRRGDHDCMFAGFIKGGEPVLAPSAYPIQTLT